MNLYPLVAFDLIDDDLADAQLVAWGHWLGGCNRPFGRQSFGLTIHGDLLAVAVSASTVNAKCGGYRRGEVVELARLCAHPDHRDLTRVALRLWRKVAPPAWGATYWPVVAVVSYSNAARHKGDIYRFDGWRKVGDTRAGKAGTNTGWTRPRKDYEAKAIWAYALPVAESAELPVRGEGA